MEFYEAHKFPVKNGRAAAEAIVAAFEGFVSDGDNTWLREEYEDQNDFIRIDVRPGYDETVAFRISIGEGEKPDADDLARILQRHLRGFVAGRVAYDRHEHGDPSVQVGELIVGTVSYEFTAAGWNV